MTMLSIVIPALNEEDGIQDIMQRVLAVGDDLRAVGVDELELVVVDDGSSDHTPELVQACAGARLVRHPRNRGYGAALKTGFASARGEWIGFLDADGTYPPEHFPALYREAMRTNADIVIGSRMAGADSQMPRVRRLGNLIFARLVSLISAEHITDSASGMRIFKKDIVERLYPLPDGLNLTPVMSTRALHERLNMVEVAIPYSERVGRSKLKVARDGVRFAQSIVWTALNYNPVRPLGLLGLGMLALAGAIAVAVIVARSLGVTALSPWGGFAVFMGAALAVSGISVVSLGISFNYFVALFHKRPVRQGLFGRPLFKRRLDQHFGWVGGVLVVLALALGFGSLALGSRGWPVSRLWFYYLASAAFALIGIQLMITWVQMQVLEALRAREELIVADMRSAAPEAHSAGLTPALIVQESR